MADLITRRNHEYYLDIVCTERMEYAPEILESLMGSIVTFKSFDRSTSTQMEQLIYHSYVVLVSLPRSVPSAYEAQ
jgi:hypothetical protein